MSNNELYSILTRYGAYYELNVKDGTNRLMENLKEFADQWKPYNPRKNIKREGLSITSLDGGLSGIPDLDSIYEYNVKNGLALTESSFTKRTPVYNHCAKWLDFLGDSIGRTHLIRLHSGGYFPIHRDNKTIDIDNFRLFIPVDNCDYPDMTFVLDRQMLNFRQGYVYFIDTCKEHYLFNSGINSVSTFIVVNVTLTEESVNAVLRNMFAQ